MPKNWIQSPYFATGNPETEEMTTLYAPGMLGCVAEFDQGLLAGPPNVCRYQLVKQKAAIQAGLGDAMYWDVKSSYTVTNVATNAGQLAGFCMLATATPASYIWILKKGDRKIHGLDALTSAPDATGKPVVTTVTTGRVDVLALATAPTNSLVGSSLAAQDGVTKQFLCRVNVEDPF